MRRCLGQFSLRARFTNVTKKKPVIWGTGIVGFGTYTMTYANGKTGDWPVLAFAARKDDITVYLSNTVMAAADLPNTLGKAKQQGGCLHIKKLAGPRG